MKDTASKLNTFKRYAKVWWMMSRNSFLVTLSNKSLLLIFLTGKVLRFTFFVAFLVFLVRCAEGVAGYNLSQIAFFFLTFNVVDVIAQFFFREVYRFRQRVVKGDLDLILVKPISSLLRSLMGGADIIDLITIPPLFFAIYIVGGNLNPAAFEVVLYILLLFNGLLIATALHVLVISMGIITLEIDHSIMIYRDVTSLGRLPVDIYKEPLRAFLTYLIPVGIMFTLPAKALMGLVTPFGVAGSFILGVLFLFLSVKFWNFALRSYTSASS